VQGEEWLGRIEAVVIPVLVQHGLTLVDLHWRRQGRHGVLTFYVDKTGGVQIGDCERFSREVGDLLDAASLMEEAYDLEVSSPGLTRELRTEREWRWAQGRLIRCWLAEAVEGWWEFAGRLALVGATELRLEETSGQVREIPRRLVTRARLELEFPRRR
jgi:ribosome maturation factor RimP